MKRYQNLLLALGVLALLALPLWLVRKPAPGADGVATEIFRGTDDHATELVAKIAPGYKPWFKPLLQPASPEIGSLLFALQAALGAGFIGYYLGVVRTRAKYKKNKRDGERC